MQRLRTRVRKLRRITSATQCFDTVRWMSREAKSNVVGYARVSSGQQDPSLQIDALESVGCAKVFVDHASGGSSERPELAKLMSYLRAGDTLVVWRLDRLGRSLRDLVDAINDLDQRGVAFRSLRESVDTGTPGGKLVFHVFASLAEFERDLIRERTFAGLEAARSRGRKGGRPSVMNPNKLRVAKQMLAQTDDSGKSVHTVADVAGVLNVSRATIYRAIDRDRKAPA